MPPKRKAVVEAGQDEVNWASSTVPQLKSELTRRGLSLAGRKSDLTSRIEADDASESAGVVPLEESDEDEAEDDIDWKSHSVLELKQELTTRGLSLDGRKADLVARLETDDASESAQGADVEQADEDDSEEGEQVDWKSYTVPELKAELQNRGLRVSGKKSDLVARLEAHDNGEDVDPPPASKCAKTSNAVPVARSAPAAVRSNSRQAINPISRRGAVSLPVPARQPPLASVQDPGLLGPLAQDLIINKHINRETGERRERDFVPAPDARFMGKLWAIRNERMFMLDRRMGQDRKGHVCQTFDIAGSTGNIYKVTIGRSPNCDCMDARMRGQKCKHINYALIVILKAPLHLQYQLAFLSDELDSIFASAPVTREPDDDPDESDESNHNGTRKPIEGNCPICVDEMEAEEELVWCKAACGQNFHKVCFEQWRASKHGGRVTCVYCRTEWQDSSPKKPVPGSLASLKETAPRIGSYRNIGHHPMYHDGGPDYERYGVEE